MAKLNLLNKWILVTGASSGLGRAIARYLAFKEKANLIIAARRKEKLEQLKVEIESASSVRVKICKVDLGSPDGADFLYESAVDTGEIYGIINNAGETFYGRTEESHYEKFENMINVNLKAVIKLSLRFLSYFKEKGDGFVLNITSMGAFSPMPYQTVYSATKHGVQAFTEGIYQECRKSGIVISTFAPGGIATEMLTKSGLDRKYGMSSIFNMNADKVAKKAIRSLKKKKILSVPGFFNKLSFFLIRFFPRKVIARFVKGVYRLPE